MGFQIVVIFIGSFMDEVAYHVKIRKRFICSHGFTGSSFSSGSNLFRTHGRYGIHTLFCGKFP
jgi:hypothetical protein